MKRRSITAFPIGLKLLQISRLIGAVIVDIFFLLAGRMRRNVQVTILPLTCCASQLVLIVRCRMWPYLPYPMRSPRSGLLWHVDGGCQSDLGDHNENEKPQQDCIHEQPQSSWCCITGAGASSCASEAGGSRLRCTSPAAIC